MARKALKSAARLCVARRRVKAGVGLSAGISVTITMNSCICLILIVTEHTGAPCPGDACNRWPGRVQDDSSISHAYPGLWVSGNRGAKRFDKAWSEVP